MKRKCSVCEVEFKASRRKRRLCLPKCGKVALYRAIAKRIELGWYSTSYVSPPGE